MKSFKSFRESMDHKSDGELLKIARSTHPHSAKAMTALKKRGVKVYNPATGKKESVSEAKKLRDLDHDSFMAHGDKVGRSDPEWSKERKRRYRNDMQINRRNQMKKEEMDPTVDEAKTYHVKAETGPHQYNDMKIKAKNPKEAEKIFRKSYKHPMGLTVSLVKEEADPTSTSDVVGTGDDVADWKTKKKKRSSVVTRHYIEVNGKRKKQTK